MTITLYALPTGNCHRVSIMLEELGLAYDRPVLDFAAGDLQSDAFLAINPVGQVPAISIAADTDGEALNLAESAAILTHLARREGRFLPKGETETAEAERWTAIATGGLQGAITTIFFARRLDAEGNATIIDKLLGDIARYLRTMNRRLSLSPFLAGEDYTYVDMLAFPTINASLKAIGVSLDEYPAITRWRDGIAARPAVQSGIAALSLQPA